MGIVKYSVRVKSVNQNKVLAPYLLSVMRSIK
jgi:hypothetical protein